MAFGFDDVLAAGTKSAGGLLTSLGDAMIGNYFGKNNAYRNASIASAVNRSDAAWKAKLDYKYAQKYADLDFEQARRLGDLSYLLQSTYQQNSAKYQVDSLRKAGLNPILAALNGAGTQTPVQVGSPGVHGSGSSALGSGSAVGSPFSPRSNIAEAMRDIGDLDVQQSSARNLDSQTEINSVTKSEKEINTAKSAFDLIADLMRGGETGFSGVVQRFSNSFLKENRDQFNRVSDKASKVLEKVLDTVGDGLNGMRDDHSAKSSDQSNPVAPVVEHSAKSSNPSRKMTDKEKKDLIKRFSYGRFWPIE